MMKFHSNISRKSIFRYYLFNRMNALLISFFLVSFVIILSTVYLIISNKFTKGYIVNSIAFFIILSIIFTIYFIISVKSKTDQLMLRWKDYNIYSIEIEKGLLIIKYNLPYKIHSILSSYNLDNRDFRRITNSIPIEKISKIIPYSNNKINGKIIYLNSPYIYKNDLLLILLKEANDFFCWPINNEIMNIKGKNIAIDIKKDQWKKLLTQVKKRNNNIEVKTKLLNNFH